MLTGKWPLDNTGLPGVITQLFAVSIRRKYRAEQKQHYKIPCGNAQTVWRNVNLVYCITINEVYPEK